MDEPSWLAQSIWVAHIFYSSVNCFTTMSEEQGSSEIPRCTSRISCKFIRASLSWAVTIIYKTLFPFLMFSPTVFCS